MNEAKETGGPAFPCGTAFQGMTLRDYFAAKAMQAFIGEHVDAGGDEHLAECSYAIADAMIEARK